MSGLCAYSVGKRRGAGTWSGESPESVGKWNMSRELRDVVGGANRRFPGLRERSGVSTDNFTYVVVAQVNMLYPLFLYRIRRRKMEL